MSEAQAAVRIQRLGLEQSFQVEGGGIISARRIWQKGPITIWENLKKGAPESKRYLLVILQMQVRKRGEGTEYLERAPRMIEPGRERNTCWFYARSEPCLIEAVADELYRQFKHQPWDEKIVPYDRSEGFPANWPSEAVSEAAP
jgi:hypothetical protein